MKYLAVFAIALITGCADTSPPPMSNTEIIKAVKQCSNAGLNAIPLRELDDQRIRVIQCEPESKEAQQ